MHPSSDLSLPTQTGLTAQQRACLDAIEAYLARTRTMPSVDDLRVALGFSSKAGVLRLLRQLEERGRIARVPLRARAIRLLDDPECPRCRERLAS
jgi:repressor LexA